MDDGTAIRVAIRKRGDGLSIDFNGTDPVHTGNLNANRAIVTSAVIYVLRCLIDEDIPLNEGVLAPVEIRLPNCFLNPSRGITPAQSPAVVGGNVETSQRIVDVLLGALGVAAASQGTMNNWLIGDATFGYYETVGGGSGATANGNGADAVHCHMSNTRLTDPEILETRYPVVLREFRSRKNSGGNGKSVGGNGMIREFEFTKPLTLSILSSRRSTNPFGLHGGKAGAAGENILVRANGRSEVLPSQCESEIQPGDRLRLLTPGGGGFGKSNPKSKNASKD
jgi:5-oxoprolinase (ATP-hydrolysing)